MPVALRAALAAAFAAVIFGPILASQGPSQPATTAAVAASPPFLVQQTPRPLPPLHFEDGGGAATTFAEFRGRVVLLNLWATGCGPCRTEMPALDRLQAKMAGP